MAAEVAADARGRPVPESALGPKIVNGRGWEANTGAGGAGEALAQAPGGGRTGAPHRSTGGTKLRGAARGGGSGRACAQHAGDNANRGGSPWGVGRIGAWGRAKGKPGGREAARAVGAARTGAGEAESAGLPWKGNAESCQGDRLRGPTIGKRGPPPDEGLAG